jgi:homoserine dehydrogenase
VALRYAELSELARSRKLQIGVEGTVMSGTPSLHLGMELLAGAGIRRVQGILNGTTNYILTQMENGASYADALAQAQAHGYAEADPTGDVEGFDAAGKVAILSALLMDTPLRLDQVDRTGITAITSLDIEQAKAAGQRWKLIGSLEKGQAGISASVKPVRLPLEHPLANVNGATNAITYTTDLLGDVTLIGPGAGRLETGYALICDLLSIYRGGH